MSWKFTVRNDEPIKEPRWEGTLGFDNTLFINISMYTKINIFCELVGSPLGTVMSATDVTLMRPGSHAIGRRCNCHVTLTVDPSRPNCPV